MNIIVTGGAGFIGSNFIFYLLAAHPDCRIVCLDKLTYAGNLSTLAPVLKRPGFRFVKLDICDRSGVFKLFAEERPDIVVNFAAESHVDRSIAEPALFLETNVLGVQVLLDACCSFGVQRFHHISTDEVYGDLPLDRPDLAFDETSPLRPSSPYSAAKAAADLLVLAYRRTFGLPVSISRCSNNYGPYQFPEKLIPLTVVNALRGRPLPLYGDGRNVRDWLHVKDHCRALDLIINRGKEGEIYNIGARVELSNLELAELIVKEVGASCDLISFVADRKGHDLRYALNADKLRKELGWQPTVPFAQGLKSTVAWYLAHRSWWEAILSGEYRREPPKL